MAVRCSTGYASQILGTRSFEQIFLNGSIAIYTGAQPETADDVATGALVARITNGGLPWTPGAPSNGLQFLRNGRFISNALTQLWKLDGLGAGTAGWFRLVANGVDEGGFSMSLPRIDGAIGLDGGPDGDYQMLLPTLAITPDIVIPMTSWWYEMPIN